MIKTIVGLILLLMPFLLATNFKDKKLGFFYILSFLIFFHLIIAVVTQAFHIFSYNIILGINFLVALAVLIKTDYKELSLEKIKKVKINWLLILVIIILLIQFFSVHYNYTGKIQTINEDYKEVENMKYIYPYLSDEWVAISLIKYSIKTNSLPLVNPLWHNEPFPNLELAFHSFISEIILLLNLNPLAHYTILTVFSALLICMLVYFILRINKIGIFSSAVTCLFVPYIVNSGNLLGLWYLIPFIMGIISMLLGFLFMSVGKRKMIFLLAFLTLIFYPPLFIFYTAALIFYFIFADKYQTKKEIKKELLGKKIKLILLYLILSVLTAAILFIFLFLIFGSFSNTFHYIGTKLLYRPFTGGSIPFLPIWKVIPIPALLLAVFAVLKFGISKEIKKKAWLIAPIIIGAIFWWLYSFLLWRIVIEYERNIITTSILIVLLSGFGLHYLIEYLKKFKFNFIKKYKILQIVKIIILILFLICSFFYTQRETWIDMELQSVFNKDLATSPAPPANNYLNEEDLKLFENIKEKNFLSIPWKGLVIGASTGNYPLDSKAGTITNSKLEYSDFRYADCEEKIKIAKNYEIDYIYSSKFNCSGFELKGISSEDLYLYRVG